MNALRDGIRRVNDAPAVLFGVWLLTLGLSVPLTLAQRGAAGSPTALLPEFIDLATGVVVRPPAMATQALADIPGRAGAEPRGPLDVAGKCYFMVWLFLAGGVIDRYARDRPTRSHGFFAAAGMFFFRFLRLAAVLGLTYVVLFAYVQPRLAAAGAAAAFAVVLALVHLLADYAQVRAVVEDRRSMIASLSASWQFIASNAGAVAALYLADLSLFVLAVLVWSKAAPSGTEGGVAIWSRFAAAQLYVFARIWVKLVFWSSEVSLFQSRLAHAGYIASAKPAWPESPAAEAIRSL